MIATTWPAPNPRAVSPPASRLTVSTSCRPVSVRPVGPSISTGASSRPAKPAKTQALIDWRGIAMSGNGLRWTFMRRAPRDDGDDGKRGIARAQFPVTT